jgi:hypothetical protein
MYEDNDRPHDYGFDLPDNRYSFITKDGKVFIVINRHWYTPEESDEPDFKVSWSIHFDCYDDRSKSTQIDLPIGSTEDQAINVAHELWKEDEETTRENNECDAMEEAERRMGA